MPLRRPPPTVLGGIAYPHPANAKVARTMSRIPSSGTSIEVALRRALWARGLRYRLHPKSVFGRPDVAFIGAKVAVFCDSSFWHGRDPGAVERIKTNAVYWRARIATNVERDRRVTNALREGGWCVLRYWDTDLEHNLDACVAEVVAHVATGRR